jgi:hypothetical protein
MKRFTEGLAERFSTEWVLLSETTQYLGKTPEFPAYEKQLMEWRLRLQSGKNNTDMLRVVREEIVALRKELRSQGYDLTLLKRRLLVQGFRNDGCIAEGFRRCVVIFTDRNGVFYLTGEDNHIALGGYLEGQLEKRKIFGIVERHYLWFRWTGDTLVISGADTETKEDFELFSARADRNAMKLLSQLKGLA